MDGIRSEKEGERLVVLACSDCGEERPHRVRYRDKAVAEMRCTECGRTIVLSPEQTGEAEGAADGEKAGTPAGMEAPAEGPTAGRVPFPLRTPRIARRLGSAAFGLSVRAASKPFRVWRQVRREGTGALKSMPVRAATKPLRLARELQEEVRKDRRELS